MSEGIYGERERICRKVKGRKCLIWLFIYMKQNGKQSSNNIKNEMFD